MLFHLQKVYQEYSIIKFSFNITHVCFLSKQFLSQLCLFLLEQFKIFAFVCQDGVWHLHTVPNRILFDGNHVCSYM